MLDFIYRVHCVVELSCSHVNGRRDNVPLSDFTQNFRDTDDSRIPKPSSLLRMRQTQWRLFAQMIVVLALCPETLGLKIYLYIVSLSFATRRPYGRYNTGALVDHTKLLLVFWTSYNQQLTYTKRK
ncbi:hypothetical protein AVEN_140356-1 [Araneus ventricosus]|uniref:Uncharacterized protein n=1 Tax=Araneus ventricosus TaxID=182803 RepID=A0A4Y2M016_ARAVE|nr:hypothetical protein AVEN_140356-1 [Araneus ventricosus]